MPSLYPPFKTGQKLSHKTVNEFARVAGQATPNSITGQGMNLNTSPASNDSVEIDFAWFNLSDVQPNGLIYQKGELWSKVGLIGGVPYQVPYPPQMTLENGQRLARVVPVKPQEKITLPCEQSLYDACKPPRSNVNGRIPHPQTRGADAVLARWDGEKLVRATEDNFDFTIFQIVEVTSPTALPSQHELTYYAEAIYRGGVGGGGGGGEVVARIVCDDVEGCRIIEPVIGTFFLIDVPITLVEQNAQGNYTQFLQSSLTPLPVNTDSYGNTVNDLFQVTSGSSLISSGSLHYRRTLFSNMGTVATHPLSEYEPIRATYVGGEVNQDVVFSWKPSSWDDEHTSDAVMVTPQRRRIRGECRFGTNDTQRFPYFLMRREPAVTLNNVVIRQLKHIKDNGLQWRYINGKHYGMGAPFDNSMANDFSALYFTRTSRSEALNDPEDNNGLPIGNEFGLDTKPFCIGVIPSYLPSAVFDGKLDVLPFLMVYAGVWKEEMQNWIPYVCDYGHDFQRMAQWFTWTNVVRRALQDTKNSIMSQASGSLGASFMYDLRLQFNQRITEIMQTYVTAAETAACSELGLPFTNVFTVQSEQDVFAIPATTVGATYRSGTGIGGYTYYRANGVTWDEVTTPTSIDFITAFREYFFAEFNGHFVHDFTNAFQSALQSLFTAFNKQYPAFLRVSLLEQFPSFIHAINATFTDTAVDGQIFFDEFQNYVLEHMRTLQFNADFDRAVATAYPDSAYPNTGEHADRNAWRAHKKQQAIDFIIQWLDTKIKSAVISSLAEIEKIVPFLSHTIIASPVITVPLDVANRLPSTQHSETGLPLLQFPVDEILAGYFEPEEQDFFNFTMQKIREEIEIFTVNAFQNTLFNQLETAFIEECERYGNGTAPSSALYQDGKTLMNRYYPAISGLYLSTLTQLYSEHTTSAVINSLLTSGQATDIYANLALMMQGFAFTDELLDWVEYVVTDGLDYESPISAVSPPVLTDPANSNAAVRTQLPDTIQAALELAGDAMVMSTTDDDTPFASICASFVNDYKNMLDGWIIPVIDAALGELTGVPITLTAGEYGDVSELPDPMMMLAYDIARVGVSPNVTYYQIVNHNGVQQWEAMDVTTTAEFNQKLNEKWQERHATLYEASFKTIYKNACTRFKNEVITRYKQALDLLLIRPSVPESLFGDLLALVFDSLALNPYTTQTKRNVVRNRYGNLDENGDEHPLVFHDYLTELLIHHVEERENVKDIPDRLQMPWRAAIALACRDLLTDTLHTNIRTSVAAKFTSAVAGHTPHDVPFQIPELDSVYPFEEVFDVGELDNAYFMTENFPALLTQMHDLILADAVRVGDALYDVFSMWLANIPQATTPDDLTTPAGLPVTWLNLEMQKIINYFIDSLKTYFAETVADEVWSFENIIAYLAYTPVHPVSPQNWEWTKSPEKAQRHLPLATSTEADPCEILVPGEQCKFVERTASYSLPAVTIYNEPVYEKELNEYGELVSTGIRKHDTFSFTYVDVIPPATYRVNPEGTGLNDFIKHTANEVEVWRPSSSTDTRLASKEIGVDYVVTLFPIDEDYASPLDGFGVAVVLNSVQGGYAAADITNNYGVVNDLKYQSPRGIFYKTDNCGRLYACAFRINTAPYGYGVRATKTTGVYYTEPDNTAPEFELDAVELVRKFMENRMFLTVAPSTQWHHTLTMCSEPPIPMD